MMCIFFFFLGHPWCMEVPRLGAESELQLLATATATAMLDLSHICNLHHSSLQRRILNPLSKARDRTCILMDLSWVHYRWATMGTPRLNLSIEFIVSMVSSGFLADCDNTAGHLKSCGIAYIWLFLAYKNSIPFNIFYKSLLVGSGQRKGSYKRN